VLLITAIAQQMALKQQKVKLCRKWSPTIVIQLSSGIWAVEVTAENIVSEIHAVCVCHSVAIWKRALLCVKLLRTYYRVY
jgi:hypothetical protein